MVRGAGSRNLKKLAEKRDEGVNRRSAREKDSLVGVITREKDTERERERERERGMAPHGITLRSCPTKGERSERMSGGVLPARGARVLSAGST